MEAPACFLLQQIIACDKHGCGGFGTHNTLWSTFNLVHQKHIIECPHLSALVHEYQSDGSEHPSALGDAVRVEADCPRVAADGEAG